MDFSISPFILSITIDRKTYKLQVEQTYLSPGIEIFTLSYGARKLVLQSNRPFLRSKGLNRKKIDWKAINGKVKYQSTLERIKEEMESIVKGIENPRPSWKDHPKNQPY